MVFAPAPELTITIEQRGDDADIHLHAGGQGIWQARMIATLGVPVVLCTVFGGETGSVLEPLTAAEGVWLRSVHGDARNAAYVHDRRDGERVVLARSPADPLPRHVLDELYGLTLAEGLRAEVSVLSGTQDPQVIEPDVYRRLAGDLRRNGCKVVADLAGEYLDAVLESGLDFLKVSHDELIDSGRAKGDDEESLLEALRQLHADGAEAVVVSRAEKPALALVDGEIYEVVLPELEPADHRGAGDSMTAGVTATMAQGGDLRTAIKIGGAAGAVNVTRHGLGTGRASVVGELMEKVELAPLDASAAQEEGPVTEVTPDQLADEARRST
ncbi:MAG TPA: phosphofructokinase [Micromonosporaceae bacterium]|nr:phosphofructokinase [Micromonosporaceae bacterium]